MKDMSTRQTSPSLPFIDLAAQRRRIGKRVDRAIARVMQHGKFILGPEVETLERNLEDFSGARHCITCANGTDALILSLLAHSIGPGDAVLVPTFTFLATAEAVVRVGATPILMDVDRDSFHLDLASLSLALSAARRHKLRPRAVIVVDLFGQPASYAAVRRQAAEHGLVVVADAAQSFGASRNGSMVGTLADITTTSFYPSKPLGCYGDGGAIFTDDDDKADRIRALRGHGQSTRSGDTSLIGMNSRLDTLQAAVLLEKLRIFPAELEARNAVARVYAAALQGVVRCPKISAKATSVWAQYTVIVEEDRDALVRACAAAGIPTAVHYAKPVHLLEAYCDFPRATADLPVAEWLSRHVVCLPMHPYLGQADRLRVTKAVVAAVGRPLRRKIHVLDPQPALPD
jgi:dTDP-4-amino-4,6-dideoxygalactose transaminase